MKELLERLLKINSGKIIDCYHMCDNEDFNKIFEEIFNKSIFANENKFKYNKDNYRNIIYVLSLEFTINRCKILYTLGNNGKPYSGNGDYIIFPWYDSNGKHNKYNIGDEIVFEY